MAIIKCKMCGGDLNISEGMTVAECEYCGTKQTVPATDSEKKLALFSRANRLRLACEFDKAAGVYESIVANFPTEAEAYWGLVLCRYGIEYVDDPATGKKVPTCHRSSFESVLEDTDFEQSCENADAVARRVYRDEAKAIEELRRGIVEVSGKEEPYDIFICYKETGEDGQRTLDSVLAQDVYDALTEKGYRVFFSRITLEDKLGQEYEPYIFAALHSTKLMLAFGTDYEYFNAVWVKNEWSRYIKLMAQDKSKYLIPCYKDIDAYDMPNEFAKLQAQDMGKVGAIQDLLRGVDKILGKKGPVTIQQTVITQSSVGGETDAKLTAALKRGNMALEAMEWDNAGKYFDQVLALNAECAEAYIGLMLTDARAANLKQFLAQTLHVSTPKDEVITAMEADAAHISEIAKKYAVIKYLPMDEITKCYTQHPSFDYQSQVKSVRELLIKTKNDLNQNVNLTRARKFASGELAQTLNQIDDQADRYFQDAIKQAELNDAHSIDGIQKNYAEFLKKTDQFVMEQSRQAAEQLEAEYQRLCRAQAGAGNDVDKLNQLASDFDALLPYQDCRERSTQCAQKIVDTRKQLEAELHRKINKERIFFFGAVAAIIAFILFIITVDLL